MRPKDLFARIRDLHRSLRFARRNRRNDLERNNFALAAKTAAYKRLNDANLCHRHLQHDRKFVLEVVRNLC